MEKTPFLVLAVCLSALTAGAGESTTNTVANLGTVSVTAHNDARLASAFARFGVDLSPYEHLAFIYQLTESRVEDPGEKHGPTPRRDTFNLDTDVYGVRFETRDSRCRSSRSARSKASSTSRSKTS